MYNNITLTDRYNRTYEFEVNPTTINCNEPALAFYSAQGKVRHGHIRAALRHTLNDTHLIGITVNENYFIVDGFFNDIIEQLLAHQNTTRTTNHRMSRILAEEAF